jgi:hypothetical protein
VFTGEKGRLVWDLMTNSVTLFHSKGTESIYADPHYDKNDMYIEMLKAHEGITNTARGRLASVLSSTKVIRLIEEAKKYNKWQGVA